MRLIAFITAPDAIEAILTRLAEPARPPPLAARARAPPEPDFAGSDLITLDQSPPWGPTLDVTDHDAAHDTHATADSRPVRSLSRRECLPWMSPGAHLDTSAGTLTHVSVLAA